MKYLSWNEKTIDSDSSEKEISSLYNDGYLFTRLGKGEMQQTRSVRIDLNKFNLSSENRRIIKKNEGMKLTVAEIPFKDYDYSIGKLAKDFYDTRFETGIMSAQKVKEMLTDLSASNFNSLLIYFINDSSADNSPLGYSITYSNKDINHYCYPFYDLNKSSKDIGLGMMTLAVEYAKNSGKKYIYLGSLQRPSDIYKLQFEGLEWFDGKKWQTDIEEVKEILKNK